MGCSSSNTNDDNYPISLPKSAQDLASQKEKFLAQRKDIDLLRSSNKIFDDDLKDLLNLNHEKFEEVFDLFWEKTKNFLDVKQFTKDTYKEYVLTVGAQPFIMTDYFYKEYSITELIVEFAKELKNQPEFAESDVTIVDDLLKNSAEKFPAKQKGFIYSPKSIKQHCFANGHINNNFKFNHEFEVNVLSFVLVKENVDNIGFLKGIAEIIIANKNLNTVCMQLFDMYEDNKPFEKSSMKNINIILNAIQENTSIKALTIMQSKGDNSLDIGNEVLDKITEVLKKDSLNFVYFFRLSFTDDFGKKIGSVLQGLNNLKFFGILSNDKTFNYLNDIFNGISRNNSLQIVLLQKYEILENKLSELKALATTCKTLKLFKYFKMINF
jgi:hypothetical protein